MSIQSREHPSLLKKVSIDQIEQAIREMMPNDVVYVITPSGVSGGFYVNINWHPDSVLLYYEDGYYQKLNEYCVAVERGE
jgi:hypothetical protein